LIEALHIANTIIQFLIIEPRYQTSIC